ncbi:TPA: Fe-S cluster protein [Candidatus Collierbacteria bacterium]|uniref:SUF system FeS assembly protein, NifU family n=1 Tax=Candidatus Collierbacteria bacterium GW2011_GWA2_42_17 TaxID=1618378 RepID=A0A0G0Z2C0_9BACT|nr:MAG: SUF system FeS assembly protein, NifU family [Candidatus Collierbacteria bacterium GW2011_GWB2_42_12]KKS42935.1 MAG: SUF system FeS assembly protein, NifU family [Candidatus Collierbacteria bacterium GW2011_GWA2_42_17]KKS61695.1 MAG: SUF system FeS assembly protein, NifU family [Candidatus Collierbacteria bacterium GW2011_GWF1_42_50]KKS62855.1 MAG: SUF system FeS assembly protein, NifU family [Candidatus Collierbacteria bacterium GW2011_GWD2_42_50]KKS64386.1 MAG: SUF system FeS assembly
MSEYREIIIDHYKNPRNMGELAGADKIVDEANASCGDLIKIYVKLAKGKIVDMKWQGIGCAISTAGASMLSEKVVDMSKTDLEKFGEEGVVSMLGGEIMPGRMKCATLAFRGLLKVFE